MEVFMAKPSCATEGSKWPATMALTQDQVKAPCMMPSIDCACWQAE
eukprot:CAMPEP_0115132836 /NCGR_PEP_ID=MMETSP0227-20121206/54022_1 /TAXON_ID=89957 /ORGANISM="Polarella glacialis, Strain CCMP 1383" /LENGTH=45 /DNA_ID= /DNA_START= /DNA_END= /DNA_ORIENTATION=